MYRTRVFMSFECSAQISTSSDFTKTLFPTSDQKSRDFHVGNDFKTFGFFLVAKLLFGELDAKQKEVLTGLIDMHSTVMAFTRHVVPDVDHVCSESLQAHIQRRDFDDPRCPARSFPTVRAHLLRPSNAVW